MKTFLLSLLGCCLAASLPAQGPADNPPAPRRSPAELAELLGPIALYPDALIALILPAATYPADIVLGARYVESDGNPAKVEDKSWDSSVKALTRYPDTLKWLDENLEWTTQVGDAFIEQPVEVMESIQQLRATAKALGNLVDTPQQRIVMDETDIRIIPAQPDYIYEPRYDPDVIYYDRPSSGPLLFFSVGYGVGSWLSYDFDWRRHRLYRGDWHEGWDYSRDRNRRDREDYYYINNNLTNSREWRPDPARHRAPSHQAAGRAPSGGNPSNRAPSRDAEVSGGREHHAGIARPKPIVGSPHRGESIRRAEPSDSGRVGNQSSPRTSHENKGDAPKGHVAAPKSVAPGMTGDGKHVGDGRDHKKTGNEPASVIRHEDSPPKKEAEGKKRVDGNRHEPAPSEAPRKKEAPKHEEAPKRLDPPKREQPKQREAPKHEEAPKRQDAPPKHQEPARREAPKQEAAKPHSEPAKEKGRKGGDKKKDEDKKKE